MPYLTQAAPAPGELSAMYDFFNIIEALYDKEYTGDDLLECDYPEEVNIIIREVIERHPGSWKNLLIRRLYKEHKVRTAWRRVIGGFDSLFETFCDPNEKTLTTRRAIVEAVNNPGIIKDIVFPDGHKYRAPDLSYEEFIHSNFWDGNSREAYDEYLRIRGMQEVSELSDTSLNSITVKVYFKGEEVTSLTQLEDLVKHGNDESE